MAKNQNNEFFDAIAFVLTVIGWFGVAQIVLALLFGITLFGPLLFLR